MAQVGLEAGANAWVDKAWLLPMKNPFAAVLLLLLGLPVVRNLKRVFLLVDARWGLKASDISLLSFFERHRIPFQLVLTKADLPEQKALIKILQIVCLRQTP